MVHGTKYSKLRYVSSMLPSTIPRIKLKTHHLAMPFNLYLPCPRPVFCANYARAFFQPHLLSHRDCPRGPQPSPRAFQKIPSQRDRCSHGHQGHHQVHWPAPQLETRPEFRSQSRSSDRGREHVRYRPRSIKGASQRQRRCNGQLLGERRHETLYFEERRRWQRRNSKRT